MMRAVLTFHAVDDGSGVLSFAPRAFADLLGCLADAGIPVLPYAELLRSERGVTLTFDDGMRSVHDAALPVLREHRVPAHLFLTTASVGRDNRWATQPATAPTFPMLDWDQVQACAAHGMLIESHTHSHPDLRSLSAPAMAEECAAADRLIEQRLGRRPRLFAYPYGQYDERVAAAVAPQYDACFTTRMAYLGRQPERSRVPRIDAYYLRSRWVRARLLAPLGCAYLTSRAWVRELRGIR